MRYLYIFLCLLMILFIAVQYNDPDGTMWMVIYAVPAVWAGIAAFRQSLLANSAASILLILSIVAAVAGMLYYWPTTPGWWRQEVWWDVETAREGMGMMIVAIVLSIVWLTRSRGNALSTT